MLAALLVSLLSLIDPSGDAIGNGTLTAPTAAAWRSADAFDILSVTVPEAETFGFQLELSALETPDAFPQAIIEIYLHDAADPTLGQNALLPGSGMRLPEGSGWHLAFQLVGESLSMFAPAQDGSPLEVSPQEIGARLSAEGNTLIVTTNLPTPRRFSLYGMSGAYDPFSESGWRALRPEGSPWGFSSVDQRFPVLDVIADTFEQQQQALAQGVLPEIRASFAQERWLLLAGAGVFFALLGLSARFFVRPSVQPGTDTSTDIPTDTGTPPPRSPPNPLAPVGAGRTDALRALAEGKATLRLPSNTPDPNLGARAKTAVATSVTTAPDMTTALNGSAKKRARVLVVKRLTDATSGVQEEKALAPVESAPR